MNFYKIKKISIIDKVSQKFNLRHTFRMIKILILHADIEDMVGYVKFGSGLIIIRRENEKDFANLMVATKNRIYFSRWSIQNSSICIPFDSSQRAKSNCITLYLWKCLSRDIGS